MTWRFRKARNYGPVRLTITHRGLAASVGVGGVLRLGLGSDGKIRRTVRIPETGLYNTEIIGHWRHEPHDPAATEVIHRHDAPTTRLPAVAAPPSPPRRAGGGRLFWGVVRSFVVGYLLTMLVLAVAIACFVALHNPGSDVTVPAPTQTTTEGNQP